MFKRNNAGVVVVAVLFILSLMIWQTGPALTTIHLTASLGALPLSGEPASDEVSTALALLAAAIILMAAVMSTMVSLLRQPCEGLEKRRKRTVNLRKGEPSSS